MKILAVVGDLHTNSTLGLSPAYVELDDGGSYKASKLQLQLLHAWKDYCASVESLRDELNCEVVVVFNGDLFDGDHHNTSQIISRNESTMHRIARRVTEPLVNLSELVYVVRGTPVHVGGSGAMEEQFAGDIKAQQSKRGNTFSWWHLQLEIEGVLIDIAHHASMGRLPWTKRNAANKLASTTLFDAADQRRRIPDLVLRSHNHRWADSHDNYRVRAIMLPGWQGKTEYINRLDPTAVPDIGGLIITLDNGSYEIAKKHYPFRMSPPQRIR